MTGASGLLYVNSFTDTRGKRRHIFRRKGHRRVTIKGQPGSAEFMDHYNALLDQTSGPSGGPPPGPRARAGTIDALILKYLKSDGFKGLAKATQEGRVPILDHFRDFKTPSGRRYGDNRIAGMSKSDVEAAIAGETPATQRNTLTALRGLIAFGIAQNECTIDVSTGIKPDKPSWTEVQPQIGVYLLMLNGEVVYIGESEQMPTRVAGHRTNGRTFDHVFYIATKASERKQLETTLIRAIKPVQNKRVNGSFEPDVDAAP
jgi:hypothetical protein